MPCFAPMLLKFLAYFSLIARVYASINQPKLCPSAFWDPNATTFADISQLGGFPNSLFVDQNNTIYATANQFDSVQIWSETDTSPRRNISCKPCDQSISLFVSDNESVYLDNGLNGRVEMWTATETNYTTVLDLPLPDRCFGLFIDIYGYLYCSLAWYHVVIVDYYPNNGSLIGIRAGNATNGSTPELLTFPSGIFVDDGLNLYVADTGNNRIQYFPFGQLSATTVAGTGLMGSLTLNAPMNVVLDADGYLFIVDHGNHRIIGSGPHGFRCIAGCSGVNGFAPDQLTLPTSSSFDSMGNMYVMDWWNSRIQKFHLVNNSCDEITTASTMADSSVSLSVSDTTDNASNLHSTALYPIHSSALLLSTSSAITSSSFVISPGIYVFSQCTNPLMAGTYCNISQSACDVLQPCQNNGICQMNSTVRHGYTCSCPSGYTGEHCEHTWLSCPPHTCWNNGRCRMISSIDFNCTCVLGWEGRRCQFKVNYCQNVTCENAGVCRPLFRDYYCECLTDFYSGRHCEIIARRGRILRIVSKSFAYIAIIAICTVAGLMVAMDVLKYYFHVDFGRKPKKLRRCQQCRRRRRLRCYCHERQRRPRPLQWCLSVIKSAQSSPMASSKNQP